MFPFFTFIDTGYSTPVRDRKSTRLNSSHLVISYAVFCLKKKKTNISISLNRRVHELVALRIAAPDEEADVHNAGADEGDQPDGGTDERHRASDSITHIHV